MDEKTCDRDINKYLSEPHASKIYQKNDNSRILLTMLSVSYARFTSLQY